MQHTDSLPDDNYSDSLYSSNFPSTCLNVSLVARQQCYYNVLSFPFLGLFAAVVRGKLIIPLLRFAARKHVSSPVQLALCLSLMLIQDICKALWCHRVGRKCETKFMPAAEGSACGPDMVTKHVFLLCSHALSPQEWHHMAGIACNSSGHTFPTARGDMELDTSFFRLSLITAFIPPCRG